MRMETDQTFFHNVKPKHFGRIASYTQVHPLCDSAGAHYSVPFSTCIAALSKRIDWYKTSTHMQRTSTF